MPAGFNLGIPASQKESSDVRLTAFSLASRRPYQTFVGYQLMVKDQL